MKKYVIITASDAKYGDFLANHWLRSLTDNVDLKNIDIVILDYGLTREQKNKISNSAKIIKCKNDGHIVNIRYRDILAFLKKNNYEQVMAVDGGDVIFQSNFMILFKEHKTDFRISSEGLQAGTNESSLISNPIKSEISRSIIKELKNKKVLNAGVIIAPRKKLISLCYFITENISKPDLFGPDQVLVNYYLYKHGFYEIDRKYNFIFSTAVNKFKIKAGVFLDENNIPIPIVHNAGGKERWRPIKNFGYGENYNKLKFFTYYWLRFAYHLNFITNPLLRLLLNVRGK